MSKNVLNEVLSSFNGKKVLVNIVGAIIVPYEIPCFQFVECEYKFMFDDEDEEDFQFQIWYESIKWVYWDDDLNILQFEFENDGFKNILAIHLRE